MKTSTYDETRWKLVPVESTQRMKDAGGSAALLACGTWRDVAKGAYSAMLAAAPTPPAAEQAQQDDDPCGAPIIGRLVCGAQHENQDPLHAEPDPALLISMATCLNHGFGLLDKKRQDEILHDMRKLWDEVVGRGYYSPAHRERYLTMLAKHQDTPTPEEEEAWKEMEKKQ